MKKLVILLMISLSLVSFSVGQEVSFRPLNETNIEKEEKIVFTHKYNVIYLNEVACAELVETVYVEDSEGGRFECTYTLYGTEFLPYSKDIIAYIKEQAPKYGVKLVLGQFQKGQFASNSSSID